MVLHAGIVCYKKNGSMLTYDSQTGQKQFYNLIAVGPHDINGVDIMFENIKTQITGEFGCACICLGFTYDSEIRQKFIDAAKEFGFVKVHITDWCSMNYFDLVPRLPNYRIKQGHVIWIFCGKYCYVWEKEQSYAEFVDEFEYTDTVGSLKWIRRKSETNPTYIFYGDIYDTKWKTVEKIFRDAVVFHYDSLNSVHGVLIGALIMADYSNVRYLKTEAMLERDIKLKINNKVILSVYKWQALPCEFKKSVKKPYGCNTLEVMSHFNKTHKKLPDFDKFAITLNIDVNGICSITFEQEQPDTEYLYVGIMPSKNKIICGTNVSQNITYDREMIAEESYNVNEIEAILRHTTETINLASNQCCSNTYVFLDGSYNNEIRKEFINSGIKHGFRNVKIVDSETMNFFVKLMIFRNEFSVEFIWAINEQRCHLWKIANFHANYMGFIYGDYSTEEGLKEIKKNSKLDADPNLILFYNNDENINDIVTQAFPRCTFINLANTVHFKEYIFLESYFTYIYDIEIDAVLDREIVAKIGDEEIVIVEAYQKLPLSIRKELKNDTNSDELIITECKNEVIHIPPNDTFNLHINIDKNGIYNITINKKGTKDELENAEIVEEEIINEETTNDEIVNHEDDYNEITEIEKQPPDIVLGNLKCSTIALDEDSNSYDSDNSIDEPPIPETKEKLKHFMKPMIMPELMTPQETQTSDPLEQLVFTSACSIPRKFEPQADEILSPHINELALLPPPSYEESQSYFRQPSPVPFQQQQESEASFQVKEEEKDDDDDDNDTIAQLRAKLVEQKQILIDRLKPKILRLTAKDDVKKISDMMMHKDISELLEYLENEELLKSKVSDALSFLHGTTNTAQRPRNQIRSRQQLASPRPSTSSNSQARPRWR